MVMHEPKAFASLSSGLLARKGGAKPAMRPQGFGQMGASLEDLGWNDMGFEAPKPTVAPQPRDADHDAFGDAVAEQPIRNPVSALTPSPTVASPPVPTPPASTPPASTPPDSTQAIASPVHGQQADLRQQFGDASVADASNAGDDGEADEGEAEDDREVTDETLPTAVAAEPVVQAAAPVPSLSIKPRIVAVQPAVNARPRVANGTGPKAAFTLRLDAQRHLRLRLACALQGRSAQMMVTEAVDRLLATFPELDTIAGQLPESGLPRRAKG